MHMNISNTVQLGRTGLIVNSLGFGALPIQRLDLSAAVALLRRAFESGVNFFDTARMYTDSEAKLGRAFDGLRSRIVIASKTTAKDSSGIMADLMTSLTELRTDYLDIYQFHNPTEVPRPFDGTERYETLLDLKQTGAIRAIGLTSHSLPNAYEAIESGLYDTVQFPFSLLASDMEEVLPAAAAKANVGFLAMKPLAGGLLTDTRMAYAFMACYKNVLPLWGMQRMAELEDFLALGAAPPAWDPHMARAARREKEALAGHFCRGCGYCLPCPQNIDLPMIARLDKLLRRSPWQQYATVEWRAKIDLARTCLHCGACVSRCPYGLNSSELVARCVEDYDQFMRDMRV